MLELVPLNILKRTIPLGVMDLSSETWYVGTGNGNPLHFFNLSLQMEAEVISESLSTLTHLFSSLSISNSL